MKRRALPSAAAAASMMNGAGSRLHSSSSSSSSASSSSASSSSEKSTGFDTELSTYECRIYTLVSVVAVACYLNGLAGDFVHDDIPAIKLNKDVIGTNPITYVFKNDFWGTPMADTNSHKSYRPLTILSFR